MSDNAELKDELILLHSSEKLRTFLWESGKFNYSNFFIQILLRKYLNILRIACQR